MFCSFIYVLYRTAKTVMNISAMKSAKTLANFFLNNIYLIPLEVQILKMLR